MHHSKNTPKSQADIQIKGKIDDFFNRFKIGTLLHRCGVRKRHGHGVRSLTETIFTLPFVGKNFFRGIASNDKLPFGKDAAYDLLKGTTYNWRRLLLSLGYSLFSYFNPLTSEDRESVLIIDDSPYERPRSKRVELLSRVRDHSKGLYMKGFRMLTICWSDGVSCLPLDFSLLSSSDEKKRICGSHKSLDKRCCAYLRRKEAVTKSTNLLEPMVKRILSKGVHVKYLLMDSWFMMPTTITILAKHIDIIGMVKNTPKIHYEYMGNRVDLKTIYRKLKKRRGKARILTSTIVKLKNGPAAKLVFVRDKRKKDWLAILSTNTELSDEDIVRIYGKRWDIEVFFKMAKQHLKLTKEIQCRDFDALIAHTTIVFMRYMFLSYQSRMQTDRRTLGDLFYACCDEVKDISFLESLHRILTLAANWLRNTGHFCEKTAAALIDAIIHAAWMNVGLSKNNFRFINV